MVKVASQYQGLGKTAQVINFVAGLYESGNLGPHLLVVPASCLDNWMRELEKWAPSIPVATYYGTQDERVNIRDNLALSEYSVLVTTYSLAL